ncbi:hypothetical protein DPEC_G00088110 [Dallia pectoralis]|uniref:Uncharacterized protein n=1 Tax=Dallia pectoralis TaxID=75939 RepID=A0ACC2H0G6_DALPE|nr:hypothetical protein DPEC_G00088110 [Dallia pectoralis]
MEQKLAEFRARRTAALTKKSKSEILPVKSSDCGRTLKSEPCLLPTDTITQQCDTPISTDFRHTQTKHWGDDWLLHSSLGLRSPTARQPGELSAYSVFNPDCQPLLGALTAEQLEGEMGYRPLANR